MKCDKCGEEILEQMDCCPACQVNEKPLSFFKLIYNIVAGIVVLIFVFPLYCWLVFLPIEAFKQVYEINLIIFDWFTIILGWILVLFFSMKTTKAALSRKRQSSD